MIAIEDVVLVLLAAGLSRRFGGSKLDADLHGMPLGLHAATALAEIPFRARVAVTGRSRIDYAAHGFHVVTNDDPARGQSRSVALGVAAARTLGAAAVLVALADMPRVTADHVRALADAADGPDAVVASRDGDAAKPPALFGRGRFDALLALTDDRGARDLIRSGRLVAAPPGALVDVDTTADLTAMRDALERQSQPDGA